jgi:hypothetical protein
LCRVINTQARHDWTYLVSIGKYISIQKHEENPKQKFPLTLLITPTKEAWNVLIFGLLHHITLCWDEGIKPDRARFKYNDDTEN